MYEVSNELAVSARDDGGVLHTGWFIFVNAAYALLTYGTFRETT